MKKYIISMMAVVTVAIAGWNYQQNKGHFNTLKS